MVTPCLETVLICPGMHKLGLQPGEWRRNKGQEPHTEMGCKQGITLLHTIFKNMV